MKKYQIKFFCSLFPLIFICFRLFSQQNFDTISMAKMDELSISLADKYIQILGESELSKNIKSCENLIIYLDRRYKKDNELKKMLKQLCALKYRELDFSNSDILLIIKQILKQIKLIDNNKLLIEAYEILAYDSLLFSSYYKQDKIGAFDSIQIKQLKLSLEKQELIVENNKIRDSLQYYKSLQIKNKSNEKVLYPFIIILVILQFSIIIYVVKKQKKNMNKNEPSNFKIYRQIQENSSLNKKNVDTPNNENEIKKIPEMPIFDIPMQDKAEINFISNTKDWLVIGASVIGKNHIENNIPCQDYNYLEKLNDGWGVVVVCDGAGSASNSEKGSAFVAKESALIFKELIKNEKLDSSETSMKIDEWKNLAKRGLTIVNQNLGIYAKNEGYSIQSLACTVIIVVYSPFGLLSAHIGDGRAGFLNEDNIWEPLITPWKGEEANQTVFITSSIWGDDIDSYIRCNVINKKILAFTLMSDGLETHSYQCSVFDVDSKQWNDPNLPYPNFFNPLIMTLKQMKNDGLDENILKEKWKLFLQNGTDSLSNEPDDKTLVIGVFS